MITPLRPKIRAGLERTWINQSVVGWYLTVDCDRSSIDYKTRLRARFSM
jgi:hypothetical protein